MIAITNDTNLGGKVPVGTLQISQNGTYDVTDYAEAEVSCPAATPTLIGTYSGNKTVNVSAYKRDTDTVNNFIVEAYSFPQTFSGDINGDRNTPHYGYVSSTSLSKSLSGNNLVVSGMGDTVTVVGKAGTSSNSRSFSWRLYHV